MTENRRRRQSKWDLVSETQTHIPTKNDEYNAHARGLTDSCDDRLYLGTNSTKHGTHNSDIIPETSCELKSSELEPKNADLSRNSSEMSKWHDKFGMEVDKQGELNEINDLCQSLNSKPSESVGKDGSSSDAFCENRKEKKDESGWTAGPWDAFCENRSEKKDEAGWTTGLDTNMAPGASIVSPNKARDSRRPDRNRSRSRSRSQSRSRSCSRSRSRSPFCGSRREIDSHNHRGRLGRGASLPHCRQFAAGRCRKGNECRYLHDDGGRKRRPYERDHHDSTWDSRYQRGRSSVYQKEERFTEQVEKRDSSGDKHTYRHGTFYDDTREKHDFNRNSKSTERCLNYMRGRCQRGANCRYVHHDASLDEELHMTDRSRERNYDRGPSSRHDLMHEHRKVYDTPCKFFAEGHCRNGQNCKFSHQALVQNHHTGRPYNDRWDRSRNSENKLSGASEWAKNLQLDQYETSYWMDGNNNAGNIGPCTSRQYPSSEFPDSQTKNPTKDATCQLPLINVPQISQPVPEQNRDLNPQKQPDQSVGENIHLHKNSALQGDSVPRKDENMVVNTYEIQNMCVSNKPDFASVPMQNFSQFNQSHYNIHQPPNPQSLDPMGQNQNSVCQTSFSNGQQQIVYPINSNTSINIPNTDTDFDAPSQQVCPTPLYDRENQQNNSLPSNRQGHVAANQSFPAVQNFDASDQSKQFCRLPPHMRQTSVEESSAKPNLSETFLCANSGNSIDSKVVTSEQIAKISNISASLAQIFGNGQQLPQLLAALNPTATRGLPSHVFSQSNSVMPPATAPVPPALTQQPSFAGPVSSPSLVQSDDTLWKGQFYDPPAVSIEHSKLDKKDATHGNSVNLVQQNMAPEPQSAFTKSASVAHEPSNAADLNRNIDIVENASRDVEIAVKGDERVMDTHDACQNKKNGKLEELDADVHADEESKKNKDTKGIRMFKHALVELVKDLLKPTWKEGNMSKEAHKTVVKKVLDKVTGALQSNIPQTQEKIDHYLAHSKPKLSKLVQAYVDKYSKI